jgi:hypothetical protein
VLLHPALVSNDPEKDAARSEIRRLVEAAVDRLPEDVRIVFIMREIEEMGHDCTVRDNWCEQSCRSLSALLLPARFRLPDRGAP